MKYIFYFLVICLVGCSDDALQPSWSIPAVENSSLCVKGDALILNQGKNCYKVGWNDRTLDTLTGKDCNSCLTKRLIHAGPEKRQVTWMVSDDITIKESYHGSDECQNLPHAYEVFWKKDGAQQSAKVSGRGSENCNEVIDYALIGDQLYLLKIGDKASQMSLDVYELD